MWIRRSKSFWRRTTASEFFSSGEALLALRVPIIARETNQIAPISKRSSAVDGQRQVGHCSCRTCRTASTMPIREQQIPSFSPSPGSLEARRTWTNAVCSFSPAISMDEVDVRGLTIALAHRSSTAAISLQASIPWRSAVGCGFVLGWPGALRTYVVSAWGRPGREQVMNRKATFNYVYLFTLKYIDYSIMAPDVLQSLHVFMQLEQPRDRKYQRHKVVQKRSRCWH